MSKVAYKDVGTMSIQLHNGTERRLRQVMRDIDNGKGGGFTRAAWLANCDTLEAAKYFVTGIRDDCATLWYAQNGRSKRKECMAVGFSCESLLHRRYSDIAHYLEKHLLGNQ